MRKKKKKKSLFFFLNCFSTLYTYSCLIVAMFLMWQPKKCRPRLILKNNRVASFLLLSLFICQGRLLLGYLPAHNDGFVLNSCQLTPTSPPNHPLLNNRSLKEGRYRKSGGMKETDEIWENDGHVTTQRAILFLFRDEDPTGLSPLPFFSVTSPLLSLSLIRYPTIIIKQRKSMDFSYFPIRGRDIPAVKYVCVCVKSKSMASFVSIFNWRRRK